jgi:hypothetical protein
MTEWNPDDYWQILRRSKRYRDGVDRFKAWADKLENSGSLRLFQKLEEEDPTPPLKRRENLSIPIKCPLATKVQLGEFSEEIALINRGHQEVQMAQISNTPLTGIYPIDAADPNLQEFLSNFGDILAFPIPYRTKAPNWILFNRLWNFRPATLTESYKNTGTTIDNFPLYRRRLVLEGEVFSELNERAIMQSQTNSSRRPMSRNMELTFEINTNFTDSQIAETVRQAIEEWLPVCRNSGHFDSRLANRNYPSDLSAILEAWDLKESSNLL